ncbi:hypothetical protein CCZ27_10355 [Thauera sinica]|nr:hypothetical protein CCZ27_10355 [Thauera sp. K11]
MQGDAAHAFVVTHALVGQHRAGDIAHKAFIAHIGKFAQIRRAFVLDQQAPAHQQAAHDGVQGACDRF